MMREILFRAKRIDNGEWVEGDLLHGYFKKGDTCICCPNWTNIKAVIPETVCQDTGLPDKNDTKIFEGDIINCYSLFRKDKQTKGVVVFSDFEYWIETGYHSYARFSDFAKPPLNETEILGNIHDNPELMEVK